MRILSVTQSYAPFYEFGGPPVKVEALASGLAGRGHEVTVLTADLEFEPRQQTKIADGTATRSAFGWTQEHNGVKSIYLPTWFRYRATSWNPGVSRYCRARLTTFDVVHIFGLYDLLGPAVARACGKQNIPYVVEPIGMFKPIVRNIFLKRVYHAQFGKKMIAGAARVIATAEQEVEELADGGVPSDKIILRRNGVAVPQTLPARGGFRAAKGIPEDALLVLFLGRLSEKKSPALLLEAFAGLPASIDGRSLWLAFAGPDESGMRNRLEELAQTRGVASRVVFAGPVFDAQKWQAYRDAEVFVLPSQNENFGNTAVEAAACGTPVVLTEHCGVAPLIKDVAGIAVRHETQTIARAVEQVLGDSALRKRFSEGGKLAAAKLGWEEPVSEMERLFGELAARRGVVRKSAGQVAPSTNRG